MHLYAETCCGGTHLVKLAKADDGYRSILDSFLSDVHSGKLTEDSIQPGYYESLAKKLTTAVAEGLGGKTFGADSYQNTLKAHLDHNIYLFSGAKSLMMLQEYNKLLTDDKGEIPGFAAFKAKVTSIDTVYNMQYLETEYNNAVASAQMADKWESLQAFDLLEYRTVGDDKVRPEHRALDGLKLAPNDPRWNTIYPPNAWNCRCTVIPAGKGANASTDEAAVNVLVKAADIQPYFKRNVGKEKTVFKNDHPYIKKIGPGRMADMDAVKNYGLKTVQGVYEQGDLAEMKYLADKDSALAWWNKNAGDKKGSFNVLGADGLNVSFDKSFKNHVLEDNKDDRWKYLHKLPAVLQQPDEVWSRLVKGKPVITYIKYYENAPVVVVAKADGTVTGTTMFEASKKGKINFDEVQKYRKGQLKYKK